MYGVGATFGEVDWAEVPTPGRVEDDDALRARVMYVAGDGAMLTRAIQVATGLGLDELAERYGLRRRRA